MLSGKGLLTPLQKDFLASFSQISDQPRFYLTGGTALAEYYLGHRLSYDLDLFTSDAELVLPISYLVEEQCAKFNLGISVTRRFASYVEFTVSRGTDQLRVDLALDSPFRFAPPEATDLGIMVNNFADLKVDKLLAFYGRAEPRDAVDLYFILQDNPAGALFERAKQKDPGFDLYWLAIALKRVESFPEEIERWPVKMLRELQASDLKRDFLLLAQEIMRDISQHGQGEKP